MQQGEIVDISAPGPDPALGVQVGGLRRSFGTVHAVRGIDMAARYGEVTALVGPGGDRSARHQGRLRTPEGRPSRISAAAAGPSAYPAWIRQ